MAVTTDSHVNSAGDPAAPPPTIFKSLSDHPAVSGGATTFFVLSHLVVAIILWVAIRAALIHVFLRYGEAAEYVGLVVFIALYLLAVRAWWNRRAAAEEKVASALPFEAQVSRAVARLPSAMYPFGLATLASRLAKAGHRNLIICLERVPIDRPIEVLFEPIAIEDCGATALSDDPRTAIPDEKAARSLSNRMRGVPGRLGWALPLIVLWMLFILLIGFLKLRKRDLLDGLAFLGMQSFFVLMVLFPHMHPARPKWFVMPGGLLCRSGGHLSKSKVQRFVRTECVTIVFRLSRSQWAILMANPRECGQLSGTMNEIDFAVRALCSPQPPPPAESIEASG